MGCPRLSGGGRVVSAFVLVAIGFSAAGCTVSSKISSYFGKTDEYASDVTGSIDAMAEVREGLTDSDLAFTRNAASDVLTRGTKDASQPWENPKTGARGSVTPLASAYTSESGRTCRDFLASYVRDKQESWMQGEACRGQGGQWVVHTLKPWRRT